MKKVICAVAAFAMVAGVATVASAEVKLSGDARARFKVLDNGTDAHTKFDSRVRVKIEASTESGVYAKTRLKLHNGTWGSSKKVLDTGYGYFGVKFNGFDISAGRQKVSWSDWFRSDDRADRLKILYKTGGTTVGYTYDQVLETKSADNDIFEHGVLLKQKISDNAKVGVRLLHVTNGNVDKDGFVADVYGTMDFAGNEVHIEAIYEEADAVGTADDAFGAYASWSATLGSVVPTVKVGMTQDGYVADDEVGWVMIGDIYSIGQEGDTIFVGASAEFAASEKLSFQANAVYMDVDATTDDTITEISGEVSYKLVKGAKLSLESGTLIYADSENAFNTVAKLEVKF